MRSARTSEVYVGFANKGGWPTFFLGLNPIGLDVHSQATAILERLSLPSRGVAAQQTASKRGGFKKRGLFQWGREINTQRFPVLSDHLTSCRGFFDFCQVHGANFPYRRL